MHIFLTKLTKALESNLMLIITKLIVRITMKYSRSLLFSLLVVGDRGHIIWHT